MKRSERFHKQARSYALWAVAILSASVAGCVWSVALITPLPSGGMLAAALGVTGLFFSGRLAQECAWYLRQAQREAMWEREREIRGRL